MGLDFWYRFTGDPKDPAQRQELNSRSPLFKAAQFTKPLLIMHGVNDPRVKLEQSELMVRALREAGKSVGYHTFKGEGHGNIKWSNNLVMFRKTAEFLQRCLGGSNAGFDWFELASWAF